MTLLDCQSEQISWVDICLAKITLSLFLEKFIRKNSPADYEKTSMVDFGTGTGSYIVELLKSGMKFAMCTDFSQIMLDKCEAKLLKGGFDERFGVKKVCLPNSGERKI